MKECIIKSLPYIQIAIWTLSLYPLGRLFVLYWTYFGCYMLNMNTFWWNKEIEKPRLYFNFVGFLIMWISYLLINSILSDYIFIVSIPISLVGLIFSIITWTKIFQTNFINKIKIKFLPKSSKYAENYDLKEVLNVLTYIDTETAIFQDFLIGNKIDPDKRIRFDLDKAKLLRLLFILFDFDNATDNEIIKKTVSHYCVNKEGEDYVIQQKASEISKLKNEQINNYEIYSKFKNDIDSVFQSFNKRKP